MTDTALSHIFEFIHKNGPSCKKDKWNGSSPLSKIYSNDLNEALSQIIKNNSNENYKIMCKTGACGRWCLVIYCTILNDRYNSILGKVTPSKGSYPAYLLSPDCKTMYLAYMMGVGTKRDRTLKKISEKITSDLQFPDFETDKSKINLRPDKHNYDLATLWYKKYDLGETLNDIDLKNDIIKMIDFHEKYGEVINNIITKESIVNK